MEKDKSEYSNTYLIKDEDDARHIVLQLFKRLKLEEVRYKKQGDLAFYLICSTLMFLLIVLVTYTGMKKITEQEIGWAIFNFSMAVIDIILLFWYERTYRKKKEYYKSKERYINKMYSGKYDEQLEKIVELEANARTIENEIAEDIAKEEQ